MGSFSQKKKTFHSHNLTTTRTPLRNIQSTLCPNYTVKKTLTGIIAMEIIMRMGKLFFWGFPRHFSGFFMIILLKSWRNFMHNCGFLNVLAFLVFILKNIFCPFFVGQCAEPVTTGGVTRTISCDLVGSNLCSYTILLLLATSFLQSSSLWMIASSGWMDQVRVVIVALLTSSLTYFAKKLTAAFTLLIIELTLVLAFSSKILVPFFYHNNPFLLRRRTIHTQTQESCWLMIMAKKISASVTSSLTFPSRSVNSSTSNSRNSTTCYAGGGGGSDGKESVRELMRE